MGAKGGGGGNGGRSGSGGDMSKNGDAGQPGEVVREANKANAGPLTPAQVQATPYEMMPGWGNFVNKNSVETKWGQTVAPKLWVRGDKERLYVPMDSTHSGTKGRSQNAGYITKKANDARYGGQEYRGLHIVPDSVGRTGRMKRAVDDLLG